VYFIDSVLFDVNGFKTEMFEARGTDSIITKYYYSDIHLLDSTIHEYYNISGIDSIYYLDQTIEMQSYFDRYEEKFVHYLYDSINRPIKKVGLNQLRDTISIEEFQYSENSKSQKVYIPERDYQNEIIYTYNLNNQLISKNYIHSIYEEYFYNDSGLLSGYKKYLSSPVEKPFKNVDNIEYKFDSYNNWIERKEYLNGKEISFHKRSIKYKK